MGCEYLSIPTSLVCFEEANFEAHYDFEDRFQLHLSTFKVDMCIRSWLDLLDGAKISIPKDINDAYNSFNIDHEQMRVEDDLVEYLWLDKQ